MNQFQPDEIFTEDPFAAVDQETMARMAKLRGEASPSPVATIIEIEVEGLRKELATVKSLRDQAVAQVAILKSKSMKDGSRQNPDGSMTVTAVIGADIVLSLAPWQELEGGSLEETAQKYIPIALEAYINGM